jgi:mono/diheme cytochrome c family protein
MRRRVWIGLALLAATAVAGVAILMGSMIRYGFSAHDQPTMVEEMLARTVRRWAAPADLRDMKNPIPLTSEALASARAHWADHCASCHGNDGKGQTQMGTHLYPKAPDMTLAKTQELSDGDLFSIIENGIRMTGMPGWGDGTAESAKGSWELVHFIRHLPKVTPQELAEMTRMNPISRAELEEQEASEAFLEGGDTSAPEQPHH